MTVQIDESMISYYTARSVNELNAAILKIKDQLWLVCLIEILPDGSFGRRVVYTVPDHTAATAQHLIRLHVLPNTENKTDSGMCYKNKAFWQQIRSVLVE